MALLVKICGINSIAAADAAVKADLCGLVFHEKSPRLVSPEAARALAHRIRGRARIAVLFADASDDAIAVAVEAARPDFLQLHGKETPERAAAIYARFCVPLIKAFAIAEPSDFASVAAYAPFVEMFLFDAKAPIADRPGGHGVAFDWQLLAGRVFPRPWLLAGGLTPDNVARAIAVSGAPGVDVSSGVETAPGVKDPALISAFLSAARKTGGLPA
jgi:phosphoribosylanthranilate isomerase